MLIKPKYIFVFYALFLIIASIIALKTFKITYADTNITIDSITVKSDFPKNIVFEINAQSSEEINTIKIEYKVVEGRSTSYGYADFENGKKVEAIYNLPTSSGQGFIPPGTKLTYQIEIITSSGKTLKSEKSEFTYFDNRFEWSTLKNDSTIVHYYGPTKSRAEAILDATTNTIKNMSQLLGITQVKPITVVAYNNSRHMASALPKRSAAISQDLVTEGTAWPDKRIVLVLAFGETFAGITGHEVMHVLISDAAKHVYAAIPTWLNEGLAEYANFESSASYAQSLAYAIFTRKLKPIWYLQTFSGTPNEILIAYGQSKSVVNFMIKKFGEKKLAILMQELQKHPDIDQALKTTYGFDQHGLDSEWRKSLGLDPLPSPKELEEIQEKRRNELKEITTEKENESSLEEQSIPEINEENSQEMMTKPITSNCNILKPRNATNENKKEIGSISFVLFPILFLAINKFRKRKK